MTNAGNSRFPNLKFKKKIGSGGIELFDSENNFW